ncbi:helix-turn-helix transcriptional regulator [Streptomyces sp. NPDC048718]|uniref:helix-turn-helix transcriptional regulator n=1 Tax=Streptomyces sp. NPDC048718 TaxID=3365587 RepID=UPI0037124EAC
MNDLTLVLTRAIGTTCRLKDLMSVQNHAADDRLASGDHIYGDWLATGELARLLKIDPSTLRRWRTARPPQGPPFVSVSGRVTLYNATDVDRWLRTRRVDPGQAV